MNGTFGHFLFFVEELKARKIAFEIFGPFTKQRLFIFVSTYFRFILTLAQEMYEITGFFMQRGKVFLHNF